MKKITTFILRALYKWFPKAIIQAEVEMITERGEVRLKHPEAKALQHIEATAKAVNNLRARGIITDD